jgi:hypothetical protein
VSGFSVLTSTRGGLYLLCDDRHTEWAVTVDDLRFQRFSHSQAKNGVSMNSLDTMMDRSALNSLARDLRVPAAGKTDAVLRADIAKAQNAAKPAAAAPAAAVRTAPAAAVAGKAPVAQAAKPVIPAAVAPKAAPVAVQAAKPVAQAPKAPTPPPAAAKPVTQAPKAAPAAATPVQTVKPVAAAPAGVSKADVESFLAPILARLVSLEANSKATDAAVATLSASLSRMAASQPKNTPAPAATPAAEVSAAETFEVTPEWVNSASFSNLKEAAAQLGLSAPLTLKAAREALLAHIEAATQSAEAEAQIGGDEIFPVESINFSMVKEILGIEGDPDYYKDEEIQAGAPVWLCAPPDPVSADGEGNQMAFRGRVLDPAFDDQGLVSLEIYEGDGNISNVSVPAYYLYAREEDGVYSEATAPKE